MRFLVTGGAGYIGSITVRVLLDAGSEVAVLDSLERGHRDAVDPRATLVVGDVGDASACARALEGCDAVLHCAGLIDVAESVREPELYAVANSEKPRVLVDAMMDFGVDALVFSSTAAVYGEPAELPISEDHPLRPINPYGASKLAFERHLQRKSGEGLRSIRLRYFNAAGALSDGAMGEAHDPETHIIPRVLRVAAEGGGSFEVFGGDYDTRDGTCVRDYVHVVDLAAAHRLALEALVAGFEGGVFNLGNGDGYTNFEVIEACAAVTGSDIRPNVVARRAGDPAVLVASGERARRVLGWAPRRAILRDIVADAWAWHSVHPEGYHSV